MTAAPLVVKFGGELLENRERLRGVAAAMAHVAATAGPLVIVHGGGKEIDAALKMAGIEKRQVDGLRITDEPTLEVVVSVLAGAVNTRLVAALDTAGAAAVGLTGADAGCGRSEAAPLHQTIEGGSVNLGRVGIPSEAADMRLIVTLIGNGFVPVVASIGLGADGRLFNVNADTFAGHLAAKLGARRLVIAGTTPGVLDEAGATLAVLEPSAVDRLIRDRTATAGMIAKLRACAHALAHGVTDVMIIDGRDRASLETAARADTAAHTTRLIGEAAGAQDWEVDVAMVIDDVQARELRFVLQTYRRQPVTFVRGEGVHLYDVDGRDYFDLLSGIGVSALGYGHPRLVRAIAEQAQTLMHTSNLFYHPLQGQLAERLTNLSGLSRAFFCNSGAEAVEACLKFARRYWFTRGEKRSQIIALEESFHGRTFGALSVTSDEHYRTPFEPLLQGVTFLPSDDPDRLLSTVSKDTAAIIVEAIQGEGGVRPLTPAFAAAINEASAKTGAIVIADEIQCGMGRTGHPFYFSVIGLKPHLISLGKALGAGVPVGAVLISDDVASAIAYGDHGTTYGGNLLACRAAMCVLDELVDGGLIAQIGRVGRHMEARLRGLASRHTFIKEVRGAGLMWGLELNRDAAAIVPAALERGVVVNRTAEKVIRLLPPLIISEAELDEALERLDAALEAMGAEA